jgi:hypothetical protein
MNDSSARHPSFIPMDSDNGSWTHVSNKKKSTNKSKTTSSNTKSVTFEEISVVKPKQSYPSSTQQTGNIRKLEEADGPIKLKTLSLEMRQEITNRRVVKQWTQADLNRFCSFPQHTIRDIESGRISPNQHQLNMLNRVLKGGIHYA